MSPPSPANSIVTRYLHTRMRVDDLDRSVAFYRDVLGLPEVNRMTSPRGSKLVFLAMPGTDALIELTEFKASGPVVVQPDLVHLAFEVADLEVFGAHLRRCGVSFSDGPHTTSSGSVIAFIDAPEGYEIELIQKAKV